ncbi:MAG: dTDP-glucose 4,6-dehydratase [Candidatus Aenigmarchaeota archaeon]|nr:dTDP-glucose 4,6-dehydratase [Candidatus Aenigmarchaeota archaeon]
MNIMVTGGAGFIGTNFVHYVLKNYPDATVTNVDKLTYAGNKKNLVKDKRHIFIRRDICDKNLPVENSDIIINFAAETHVDRSIQESSIFVKSNILGVQNLLELCRRHNKKFIHISTDEVYGSVSKPSKESSILNPGNPYSATKAGADLLVLSYVNTYNLDALITRSSNNYGPYQNPEKLISKLITNAIQDMPLPIYGNGKNVRDWIFVEDNCSGIDAVCRKGKKGEIYNIAGKQECQNVVIAKKILLILNKMETLIQFVQDRPGHDQKYSLDITKIKKLGWKPKHTIEQGLEKTIEWYQQNTGWWK